MELVVLKGPSRGGEPRRALSTETQSASPRGWVTVDKSPPAFSFSFLRVRGRDWAILTSPCGAQGTGQIPSSLREQVVTSPLSSQASRDQRQLPGLHSDSLRLLTCQMRGGDSDLQASRRPSRPCSSLWGSSGWSLRRSPPGSPSLVLCVSAGWPVATSFISEGQVRARAPRLMKQQFINHHHPTPHTPARIDPRSCQMAVKGEIGKTEGLLRGAQPTPDLSSQKPRCN